MADRSVPASPSGSTSPADDNVTALRAEAALDYAEAQTRREAQDHRNDAHLGSCQDGDR